MTTADEQVGTDRPGAADSRDALTIAFVGYATGESAARASEFEDAVLPLIEKHGGRVLFRGRRRAGQDEELPLEVHLLWFPSAAVLDAYIADPRRLQLLTQYTDVFRVKHSVELETVTALADEQEAPR